MFGGGLDPTLTTGASSMGHPCPLQLQSSGSSISNCAVCAVEITAEALHGLVERSLGWGSRLDAGEKGSAEGQILKRQGWSLLNLELS